MELCQKETLNHKIRQYNIKNEILCQRLRMVHWFKDLCTAIAFIHKSGFFHRDVKPTNVFFSQTDIVKLGDFGLATDKPYATQTASVGTRLYISPEQLMYTRYDKKTDIFSLGICSYYLSFKA